MFEKYKERLRVKLREFLDVNTVEKSLYRHMSDTRSDFHRQDKLIRNIEKRAGVLQNTLSNVVSIGSDIHPYDRGNSWAVVCVEGNYNVVKFFDLSHRDGREMLKVLKAFEGGRRVDDTPIGFFPKDTFINWDSYE